MVVLQDIVIFVLLISLDICTVILPFPCVMSQCILPSVLYVLCLKDVLKVEKQGYRSDLKLLTGSVDKEVYEGDLILVVC